ncbi:hypothetical protein CTI10_001100 [Delftia acidovorans]|uniref:Carbohydrate-binding protein n=1 Tax=Chryseobacterium sp. B5 TaxID=2050562 RepID=A0A2G7T0L8_9FLAO|nr:hypothetical protein CTI10_001100 [Delftia acidovorans]
MSTSARVMVPVKITSLMIAPGTTVPEPNTVNGEVAWVASGSYAIDDLRTSNGSVYSCTRAHSGRTARPEADPGYWLRKGPTDRMAPFDDYSSTKARGKTAITFVLTPGFINGVSVYGPEGATYSLVVRDAPGGTVIREQHGDLFAQAAGFWELLFAPLPALEKISMDGIPIAPNAEVSVTINSPGEGAVAVGDIKVGDWRQLIGDSSFGGTEYGAEAQRKSYTYRQFNDDGTYQQIPRGNARDVTCRVVLSAEQAMYADAILGEVIDMAVPFEASDLPRYGYLNTLGFLTGSIRADNWGVTSLNLIVKGSI